jgi:hypothetical protein
MPPLPPPEAPTSPPCQHSSFAPPTPSPPPSCHPALLVEDEVASVYRATIYADFHKTLCERLHQVLLSQQHRNSPVKRRRASETHDEQDAPSKQPCHHRPSAKPRKSTAGHDAHQSHSVLPNRADTLLLVTGADFSWWRPLTPSPSITPMKPKRHGTGDDRRTYHDCDKGKVPHIQIPAACASDDRSIQVSGDVHNSSNDT